MSKKRPAEPRMLLKRAHRSDCSALRMCEGVQDEELWDTPWFWKGERIVWGADTLGRVRYGRFGNERWAVVRCNAIDCPAELWVNLGDLEKTLHQWFTRTHPGG